MEWFRRLTGAAASTHDREPVSGAVAAVPPPPKVTAASIRAAEASGNIDALITALRSDDFEEHEAIDGLAAAALRRLRSPRVAAALLAVVTDPKVSRRLTVIELLGDVGDQRALPLLLELAQHDEDETVRRWATRSLGNLGGASAVPALLDIARHDEDLDVRGVAMDVVGPLVETDSVLPLIGILQTPYAEDQARSLVVDLRRRAAGALGRLGDARAVDALIAALDDPSVADAAAIALTQIDDERAVMPLARALSDRPSDEIAQFLERHGHAGLKQLLMAAYQRNQPHGNNRGAVRALVDYGGEDIYQLFATSLVDGYEFAAYDLAALGDPRGIELVAEAFREKGCSSPTAAAVYADALVRFGEPGIKAMLDSCEQESSHYVREAAAQKLEKAGDPRAAEVVIPDPAERSRLAKLRADFEAMDYSAMSVDQLVDLLTEQVRWMSQNEDRYSVLLYDFKARSIPIDGVGQQLYERGGEALMRDVLGRVPKDYQRYVEREWSDIGTWMG